MLILIQMFVITGGGLTQLQYWSNDGKRPRYSTDYWDRVSGTRFLLAPTLTSRSKVQPGYHT